MYCGHTERGSVTRAPGGDHQAEVGGVHLAVAGEVRHGVVASPVLKDVGEVGAVDHAIAVDVGDAWEFRALGPELVVA